MRTLRRIGVWASAVAAAAFAGASPSSAMSERDATAINQKTTRALFYAGLADVNMRAIRVDAALAATNGDPDKVMVCRNVREAKPYYAEARPLAAEVMSLIGPDMFGEYKVNRAKMAALIAVDDGLDTLLKDCPAP